MSYSIKISFFVIAGVIVFTNLVYADGEIGSYSAYTQAIEKVCYATTAENGRSIPVWNRKIDNELPPPLTTFKQFVYPDIFDVKAAEKYSSGLKSLK